MSDITVTVTGPGGTITYEMIIIRRALEAAGVKVNVIDDHPADDDDEFAAEIRRRLFDDAWAAPYSWSKRISKSVDLVAKHCPWGG